MKASVGTERVNAPTLALPAVYQIDVNPLLAAGCAFLAPVLSKPMCPEDGF